MDDTAVAPVAKPSIKAGLSAVKATPMAEGDISQQVLQNQQKMAGIQSDFDKQYAAVPKVDLPGAEFHPMPAKESSELFSLLMIMGALGGRATNTPMTAAMNNMTGILKGQKEKNDAMVAEQKDQFKLNFDSGMAKYKGMMEEKKNILEKYHYDMAAAQGELNTWKLQHGVSDAVHKSAEVHSDKLMESHDKANKLASDLKIAGIHAGTMDKAGKQRAITALTNKARELSAKTSNAERKAAIQKQLEADIAGIDKESSAEPAAKPVASATPPAGGKPTPTAEDIAYVKAHPETKAAFVAHFGREP